MNRVITAQSDPDSTRAYWTVSRGNTERAFLAARRHSRLVRILRIAVPAAVSFALVVVILITYLNPLRMLARLPPYVGHSPFAVPVDMTFGAA